MLRLEATATRKKVSPEIVCATGLRGGCRFPF